MSQPPGQTDPSGTKISAKQVVYFLSLKHREPGQRQVKTKVSPANGNITASHNWKAHPASMLGVAKGK